MNRKYKKMVFYILIINQESQDHVKLRTILNRMAPNCFIESIYSEEEAIRYFKNLNLPPNLIILDMDLEKAALRLTIYMIKQNNFLKDVPIVLVNSSSDLNQRRELKNLGINEFYTRLKNPIEMRVITNDLKNRWLMPRLV